MKEETYDKLLIRLALLGPLALIALSQWQASLITWYEPWRGDTATYFGKEFEQDVHALPGIGDESGSTLLFIADKSCPCTKASLATLQAAMQKGGRNDMHLVAVDVNDPSTKDPAWARVLRQIPATPTLLVTEGKKFVYGGPVNSGNLCTTSVQKILGLSVLDAAPQRPVINRLEKGCYCSLKHKSERVAALPPAGMRATKRIMKSAEFEIYAKAWREECLLLENRIQGEEFDEASSAFIERRQPDFSRFS